MPWYPARKAWHNLDFGDQQTLHSLWYPKRHERSLYGHMVSMLRDATPPPMKRFDMAHIKQPLACLGFTHVVRWLPAEIFCSCRDLRT